MKHWFVGISVLLLLVVGSVFQLKQDSRQSNKPMLIAHAGGGIEGLTYINSLEVLDHNYSLGHRYFEIDFSWTSDEQLVLIHDWKKSYKRLFNNDSGLAPDETTFSTMKMLNGHTQLTLKKLLDWLKKHPDAHVLADIKDKNLAGLRKIQSLNPLANKQFVAQIFHPDDFKEVKAMGFNRVVYSLYKIRLPTTEITTFLKKADLFALAMKKNQVGFNEILQTANNQNIFVYVQTINNIEEFNSLKDIGVNGIYTDFIYEKDNKLLHQ